MKKGDIEILRPGGWPPTFRERVLTRWRWFRQWRWTPWLFIALAFAFMVVVLVGVPLVKGDWIGPPTYQSS